ncbi:MAG: hypothetical protein EB059_02525 [Alphaproteobacteria bacterium]|nr:hypothetical protein [Alphaproteobacteria bacterium]
MKKLSKKKTKRADDAPLTIAELKTARPLQGKHLTLFQDAIRRGRPAGRHKEVTSVSFDADVLAQLRLHKGWQTWLNGLAKAALGMPIKSK